MLEVSSNPPISARKGVTEGLFLECATDSATAHVNVQTPIPAPNIIKNQQKSRTQAFRLVQSGSGVRLLASWPNRCRQNKSGDNPSVTRGKLSLDRCIPAAENPASLGWPHDAPDNQQTDDDYIDDRHVYAEPRIKPLSAVLIGSSERGGFIAIVKFSLFFDFRVDRFACSDSITHSPKKPMRQRCR